MSISPPVMIYVVDPLERALRTFVQQFVVALVATGSAGLLVHQNWVLSLDSAAFAALISIATSVLTFKVPAVDEKLDVALRVVKTFLQSFVGTLIASGVTSVSHVDWKAALALAFPVALSAFWTSIGALALPGTAGASFIPAGTIRAVESNVDVEVDAQALALAGAAPTTLASLTMSDSPTDVGKHRE